MIKTQHVLDNLQERHRSNKKGYSDRAVNIGFVIVTPTYSGVAKYHSEALPLLDAFWPGHPPAIVFSDRNNLTKSDVIVKSDTNWLDILLNGLLSVRKTRPEITYVFLLLDDHYPLRACDCSLIAANFDAVVKNRLGCISFVTYEWPWARTEHIDYPDGMIRTWRNIDVTRFNGCEMARIPFSFFRYFQLQPSFWELDYLIEICREAFEEQCFDPWSFESFSYSQPRQHYVSRYAWPSVHHGFLVQGKVNPEAIDFIQMPEGREFRRLLLRESIGCDSVTVFRILRFLKRLHGGVMRLANCRSVRRKEIPDAEPRMNFMQKLSKVPVPAVLKAAVRQLIWACGIIKINQDRELCKELGYCSRWSVCE